MSYKVFISSSQKDLDLARDLAKRIEDAGVTVSSGEERSQPQNMVRWQVGKKLRSADEVVVILSGESLDNPSLMFELGAASSLRKRVTPVVVGVEQNKVPSLIKSMKYITYPQLEQFIVDLEKRAKAA
jgi:TIR domain